MRDRIERLIRDSLSAKEGLLGTELSNIERAAWMIINCVRSNGKIMIFGNGGSAADSQHMAAELVGRFKRDRKAIAAIALTTDTSIITAVANDYGYDRIFSRQIEALGRMGDISIGISTSGNSPNVIKAVEASRLMGIETICIAGGSGGKLKGLCDLLISVGTVDTPRIQEAHITIIHILCELIEEELGR